MEDKNKEIKLSFRQRVGLRILGVMGNNKEISLKDYPISQLLSPNLINKPIWKDWNTENAVNSGFKSSSYVYACVFRLMKSAASVPWLVETLSGKDWEEDENHPLKLLIDNPNPYFSWQDMIERMTAHLYLGGNGIWQKIRVGSQKMVAELWPLPPDAITPVPNVENFIGRYEYRYQSVIKNFEPNEILHIMFTDPGNVFWGMSPLQAGAKIVDTDNEAVNWNKIALQNRAVSDGLFSFKMPMTKDQYDQAKTIIKDQHQGSANARMPWVLGNDATWQQMSLSPVEMDFLQSRKMTREDICSIFQVPPPLVGIYENATLANIETARKIFWLDTVIPYLDDLKSGFDMGLAKEFGPNVRMNYDLKNVQALRENFGQQVNTAQLLFNMGVPFNEINKRLELGFEELDWGDMGYLNAGLVPAGGLDIGDLISNGGNGDNAVEGEVIPPKALPEGKDNNSEEKMLDIISMQIKEGKIKTNEDLKKAWRELRIFGELKKKE